MSKGDEMRVRWMRIAFSVTCVVIAALLVVFWVRSWDIQDSTINWYGDQWKYEIPGTRIFKALSNRGAVRFSTASFTGGWTIQVPDSDRPCSASAMLRVSRRFAARYRTGFLS